MKVDSILDNIQDQIKLSIPTKKIRNVFTEDIADDSINIIIERPPEVRKRITDAFPGGRFDKLNLPLYLFLSGAGTGKSRNANEFHQTAITCLSAQEDEELLTRIKEAWVFLISFENGFNLQIKNESDSYLAIGTRMLFQLLREKMELHKIIETYEPPNPLDVVSLISKYYNQNKKNITVILVVDGMQQLMKKKDDGLYSNSKFYSTLTSVANLAFNGIFLMPVCTSTISGLVNSVLRYSTWKCIYLPVPSLQPQAINKEIVRFWALEALNDCLAGRNIEECNIDTLMNDLYKPIPKTNKTPDEFAGSGLIRFEQIENSSTGYLTAPYIWFWIFVEISQQLRDPIFQDWEFANYGKQRALLNPVTSLQAKL
ncbi:hypothetical protein Glove_41g128 [Diversispora epigaea]|uniref:Uncharacterized protein n=1 Tax=Diversispora epigaea TaxID=1348612 RepID=A0A397JHD9_9GLOM|nr:hypothetical protein Glove_41g128 [Diversispora epigaea]